MLPIITSLSNPRIKAAVRLRESRVRRKEQRFLIDGVREVRRALDSGIDFADVYLCVNAQGNISRISTFFRSDGDNLSRDNLSNNNSSGKNRFDDYSDGYSRKNRSDFSAEQEEDESDTVNKFRHENDLLELTAELEQRRIAVWPVLENVFEKISFGHRNESIIAVGKNYETTLVSLEKNLPKNPVIGILEHIEKPGNIGAVYRSADGAGIDALILVDSGTDLFNPNTVRASLGTMFRIPTATAGVSETLDWLKAHHIAIVAARCDVAVPYTTADLTCPVAIALGSESDGLTSAWQASDILGVKLPMLGIADSLNISNAAAILFYEARRQRDSV